MLPSAWHIQLIKMYTRALKAPGNIKKSWCSCPLKLPSFKWHYHCINHLPFFIFWATKERINSLNNKPFSIYSAIMTKEIQSKTSTSNPNSKESNLKHTEHSPSSSKCCFTLVEQGKEIHISIILFFKRIYWSNVDSVEKASFIPSDFTLTNC